MNKLTITAPDDFWGFAPEWAEWITVASNGGVCAWENKPKLGGMSSWMHVGSGSGRAIQVGLVPPEDEWAECIWQRPKEFSPPWDKVASPFDWWVYRKHGQYAEFFTTDKDSFAREYCIDVWSDLDGAEPEVVYRRPESENE